MVLPITRGEIGTIKLGDGSIKRNWFMLAALETDLSQYKLDTDGMYLGRDFDGLVAGTFKPGNWPTEVTFAESELDTYLKNTLAIIQANREEDGDILGLPIDARAHNHEEAAGFIVDASMETTEEGRKVLRFTPKWNEAGLGLIASNQFRWFSGDIDTITKTIHGGTLTNWPAIRAESGENLLRPIQLEGGKQIILAGTDDADDSITQFIQKIVTAFQALDPWAWVLEVFDDHIVADIDNTLYSVDYSIVEEIPIFAEKKNWLEVKQVFVEATDEDEKPSLLKGLKKRILPKRKTKASNSGEKIVTEPKTTHENPKEIKDGGPEVKTKEQIALETYAAIVPRIEDEDDETYLARIQSLGTLSEGAPEGLFQGALESLSETNENIVKAEVARLAAQNDQNVKLALQRMEYDNTLKQFSIDATSGLLPEHRGGLPVDPELIYKFTRALNTVLFSEFQAIIDAVLKNGLVSFEEGGHGKKVLGTIKLDAQSTTLLHEWLEDEKHTTAAWFSINKDMLGEMEQYDLSEYEKEA